MSRSANSIPSKEGFPISKVHIVVLASAEMPLPAISTARKDAAEVFMISTKTPRIVEFLTDTKVIPPN